MDNLSLQIERLDHLGIVAGTIKDLKIIEMIDERIKTSSQEKISTGEAAAGMILNGLGLTSEALYLSPKFFENKALSNLFGRNDINAKNFNARKLSDSLDNLYNYGLEKLFFELAISICRKENVNNNINSLDTTSVSLTGNYDNCSDEHEILVTHGFSKDKRPDLKQVVHEMLVSQDGGIPLMMQTWSGNNSDSSIFRNRVKELITNINDSDFINYLVADSKLYNEENAENLEKIEFITRIPVNIKKTLDMIDEAISKNQWQKIDSENKYHVFSLTHYNVDQRWIVVHSLSAKSRAEKKVEKKIKKELESLIKNIKNINKHKFVCKNDINKAIDLVIKKVKFHDIKYKILEEYNKKDKKNIYKIDCEIKLLEKSKLLYISRKSCYVIGSNIKACKLRAKEIIKAYKNQNSSIENMGFRFLKDPTFFTSSLFVKLPRRIKSLLFIMTLSLLVYSIAQRKLRNILKKEKIEIPDQLNRKTNKPTLKWVFKLLNGINVAYLTINGIVKKIIEGITSIKDQIITLFGVNTRKIYGFQT